MHFRELLRRNVVKREQCAAEQMHQSRRELCCNAIRAGEQLVIAQPKAFIDLAGSSQPLRRVAASQSVPFTANTPVRRRLGSPRTICEPNKNPPRAENNGKAQLIVNPRLG
jgi:hypothetical protein